MTFHASAWQIALAALLPIFFCLLLFLAETKGPLSKTIRESTGLVAPYFTVISILFGKSLSRSTDDAVATASDRRAGAQLPADGGRRAPAGA